MLFVNLDPAVKRQIKASMKRITSNLIKININNLSKLSFSLAFKVWSARFIRIENGQQYYDFILINNQLNLELLQTMKLIFNRELERTMDEIKAEDEVIPPTPASTQGKQRPYAEIKITPRATLKQINYANYLMNMINNKSLPEKIYTKSEMSLIISTLKKQLKSAI